MLLFFNYSDQIYVNDLMHQISYEDIYDYVKLKKYENDFNCGKIIDIMYKFIYNTD